MIKNRKIEEVDPDPQADAPDLSDEAIARIRGANCNLEENFRPTSSLFSDGHVLIDEEKHIGIHAVLADADMANQSQH